MLIMKKRTKLFLILWISSIIASILVLPYIYDIQGELLKKIGISFSLLILIGVIQGGISFGITSFLGLILAEKTGFKLPLLTSWIEHKKIKYNRTFWLSVFLGLVAGILIFCIDKFVFPQSVLSAIKVEVWKGFLACFYGGIAEEIIMRLFLMTLFVFLFVKIFRRKESNSLLVWVSIILVSILFGLGHLPITSAVTDITPMVIFRAILLNGVGGIIFGWLYWKKGLESAMIAHFSTDIVLHVIGAS